jgi:hypothetical protein
MYHNQWNTRKGTVAVLAAAMGLFSLASPARAGVAPATKCKTAISKAAATFERSKLKWLQKCEDSKRKGKLPATTICLTETKTAASIAKEQAKVPASIGKACSGATLSTIGWAGLAKTCSGGKRPGVGCGRETECPGICIGGGKDDESCTFNSSCANRVCVHANCIGGGARNGTPCDSASTKAACEAATGVCNWLNGCDGGSSGALGNCNGGTKNQATCNADSDCPGGFCDPGCNTGSLLDCQAGVCDGAMCGNNKDCGLCQAGSPNQNQSCAADTDCGKLCVGGTKAGAACKVAATDCPGGGTCSVTTGSCVTGTCTAGFCSATSGLAVAGDARPSTGLCLAVDRCPAFESNKLLTVKTCDGGSNNGKFCTSDAGCTGGSCKDGCDFALSSTADVASCLTCIGEASVDQINQSVVYGEMKPATYSCVGGANDQLPCTPATASTDCPSGKCKLSANDKAIEKCKQGLGKAAQKFFDQKRNFLEQCEERILTAGSGSCPDATATPKIKAASDKLLSGIAKACAGKDKAFGGTGTNVDALPDDVGNLFTCANFTVPGAPVSCAGANGRGAINTLDDLAQCIQCLTEFKVDCTDRIAAPATGAVFPECNPLCGNGKIDGHCSVTTTSTCGSTLDCPSGESCVPIETCDDGNAVSGDTCPSNCVIQSCTLSGSTKAIQINVTAPAGVNLAGLSVYVEYPDGTVAIPGHGNDQSVQDSLTVPFDAFSSINDLDYAVRITLIANSPATVPNPAAVVQLDQCSGAAAPTDNQFRCAVESAADTNSNNASGVSCSVTVL